MLCVNKNTIYDILYHVKKSLNKSLSRRQGTRDASITGSSFNCEPLTAQQIPDRSGISLCQGAFVDLSVIGGLSQQVDEIGKTFLY
jgi:hypothetical protein